MSFFGKPPSYRAYLLRMWEERSQHAAQPSDWRFSLEDAETGKRRGFAELPALVSFLQAELARSSAEPVKDQNDQSHLARLLQSVKETFRPLADAELGVAAAAGNDQPAPAEVPPPDDDQPTIS